MRSETSAVGLKMKALLIRKLDLFLACVVALIAAVISVSSGMWGQVAESSDDIMRLLQIRDLLDGQNWFDLAQYRMGPPEGVDRVDGSSSTGTLMHWSRLVDLPIAAMILLFDVFFSRATAENLAMLCWPVLCAGVLYFALAKGVQYLQLTSRGWAPSNSHTEAWIFLALLVFSWIRGSPRFTAGSLDHHNIQLVLIAISVALLLGPIERYRLYVFSGISAALSVAIGFEIILFVALICAFPAIVWLVEGERAKTAVKAFGLSFSATLLACFVVTTAPSNYGAVYCDMLSLPTLCAGVVGGVGLAISVHVWSDVPLLRRLIAVGVTGGLALLCLLMTAPGCLSNPLDALPDIMHTYWLDHVDEARPLFHESMQWTDILVLCSTLLAIGVGVFQLMRANDYLRYGFLLGLLIICLFVTIYQIRFYPFVNIFGFLILAPWITGLYESYKTDQSGGPVYILALAAALPATWVAIGLVLSGSAPESVKVTEQVSIELSADAYDQLNDLQTGRFLASFNNTSRLLLNTKHSALGGNYHRNIKGNMAMIQSLLAPEAQAKNHLKDADVDYILYGEDDFFMFENAPESLAATLSRGDGDALPTYLERVNLDDLEGLVVYRVLKERL